MLDVILLALGLGFFVLTIGYTNTNDQHKGDDDDLRLFARCDRDRGAVVLPHLRFAAARAVLRGLRP